MAVDEKTRANGSAKSNIMPRGEREETARGRQEKIGDGRGGGIYDTNEESKTLEPSNNEVRRDEFTQSRFQGLAIYRCEIFDNSRGIGEGHAARGYGRRVLFLISSSPHSYQSTIVSWTDITVSPLVRKAYLRRGVVGVMTR